MTLSELMGVFPGYVGVLVHDSKGKLALKGHPHDFLIGLYQKHGNHRVQSCIPIAPYTVEITIEEVYT